GRCRSAATSIGRWPSDFSQWASFPAKVVLPAPWRPASMITVGGRLARLSRLVWPPRMPTSSSLTILTTCWPGLSAAETSSDSARSRIRPVKARTTGRATSASSRARLISRMVASTSASDSRPLPRRFLKVAVSLSDRELNTYKPSSRWFGRLSRLATHPYPAETATTGNAPLDPSPRLPCPDGRAPPLPPRPAAVGAVAATQTSIRHRCSHTRVLQREVMRATATDAQPTVGGAGSCRRRRRRRVMPSSPERVGLCRVFEGVDSLELLPRVDPQTHRRPQDQRYGERDEAGEDDGHETGEDLSNEEFEAASVEESGGSVLVREGEESDHHGADDAGDEVDGHDVERIVIAQAVLRLDGEERSRTCRDADEDGRIGVDVRACRSDRDETGDRPRDAADAARPRCPQALDHDPGDHAGGRRGQGVDPDEAALLDRGGRAAVEAEPAEPQQGGSEHRDRNVVRLVRGREAGTAAHDDDEHERRDAGIDVDDRAAGEVDGRAEQAADRARFAEQSVAPDHECQRAVHEGHPGG